MLNQEHTSEVNLHTTAYSRKIILPNPVNQLPCINFFCAHCALIQCCAFIMLYLGSIGMDCVRSESCYKGITLRRNYRKMTIYNCFEKFHNKQNGKPLHDSFMSKSVLKRGV